MKTLSKMAVIGGLLIVMGLLGANAAQAQGVSGKTTITETYTSASGFAVRLANGTNPCGGNGYWGFDHRTTGGGRMMATLMTAYASGRQVWLNCDGVYGGWNKINAIFSY